MQLVELYKSFLMALVNFVMFLVLKIFNSLVSIQNSSNANNCWRKQNFETCLKWP